jgi:hypothetical protein
MQDQTLAPSNPHPRRSNLPMTPAGEARWNEASRGFFPTPARRHPPRCRKTAPRDCRT